MGGLAWPQGQYRTRAMGVRRKDTALGEVCWGVEIGGEFLTSWGWGRLRRTKRGNYAQQGSSAPPQKQRNPCLRSLHPLLSLRGHWHSQRGTAHGCTIPPHPDPLPPKEGGRGCREWGDVIPTNGKRDILGWYRLKRKSVSGNGMRRILTPPKAM